MTVEEILKKNRPNLSQTSIRTYSSLIKNLGKKLNVSISSPSDVKTNLNKVMEHLKDTPARQRKTTLSALLVLSGDTDNATIDKIRSLMMEDIRKVKEDDRNQEMTDKQKENWIDWKDVQRIYNDLEKSVAHLWKKDNLSKKEFLALQDYVLLSCLVLIPPRRSLDYTLFKIRDVDKNEDNYMDKKSFVFNKYKTSSVYKKQTVEIPPKLKKIITDWMKKNSKSFLLLDTTMEQPLIPSKLTNRLYNLFDKKVSVNMLRHSYVSDVVLPNMPALRQLDKVAEDMGNSAETQINQYKKIKK